MSRLTTTASQTVGPFFKIALLRADAECQRLVSAETLGERIRIEGHVIDGDGLPIPDAMIEIWQANAAGRYRHPADERDVPLDPAFIGFGRCGSDAEGRYWFETIRPGRVPFNDRQLQAAHICVAVFARGMLNHACSRLYFADDPATATDPLLELIPVERRATLLAAPHPGADQQVYHFDIILQGAGETVFFNL